MSQSLNEPEFMLCISCDETYPFTSEVFPRHYRGSQTPVINGLQTECRLCKRLAIQRHQTRQHYRNHKEKVTAEKKAARARNREVYRGYSRKHYQKNRERLLARRKQYRLNNPGSSLIASQRRKARKKKHRHDFTTTDWAYALNYFFGRCAVCGRQKDLFSERIIAADHWIPLINPECPGTIPRNIVPLCHGIDGCNNKKGPLDPERWLNRQFNERDAQKRIGEIEAFFATVRNAS